MVCVRDDGRQASLERRKLYVVVPDARARRDGLVRVIDESGEDYLYPTEWFAEIAVSPALASALELVLAH